MTIDRRHAYWLSSLAALAPAVAATAASATRPVAVLQASAPHTVSLRELSVSAANAAAFRNAPAVINLPRHRFPDGAFSRNAGHLPVTREANVAPIGITGKTKATGFTGITGGSQAQAIGGELEPPDQGLAVNNGELVEIVNNSLQVFDSTGKALSQPVFNGTFFGTPTANNLSDPHAVYDPSTQRWFVEELEYGTKFTGFDLAVSQTSDPLGKYTVYRVSADSAKITGCGKSLCLPDYPQVGFDANGFYIAADLFSNSSGQFVNTGLYALPKATLVAGTALTYTYFLEPEFVLQPSIPAPGQAFDSDANGTELLMTARNIFDGSNNVRVYAISNTANIVSNPGSLTSNYVDVAGEAYTSSVPSTEPNDVGSYGLSQGATTSPQLDGGYNAFGGGVKYANGELFGALTSGTTDAKGLARDQIAWFAVKPTVTASAVTATITAQGYVTPPTGYSVSYPSFALSKTGAGVMGGSITSPNATKVGGYPSTWYAKFTGTAVTNRLTIVGRGAASDDGFSGYNGAGPAGVGRWGDYAAGMVDPATGKYYVANEFIPDPANYPRGKYTNYGTFITQVPK